MWGKYKDGLGIDPGYFISRETNMCVYIVSSLYLVFKCGKTTQLKKHPKILSLEMRLSNYA